MPGSYFTGSASFIGKSMRKIVISNSQLTTSSVDMNSSLITSVQDPVNQQDAATKHYVDALVGYTSVLLYSTDFTTITGKLNGSIQLIIEAVVDDGPCAIFLLSKSKSSKEASITRQTSAPGDSVNKEQLDIRWSPGLGIQLRKTNIGFDGEYMVRDATTVKFVEQIPFTVLTSTDYTLVSEKLYGCAQIIVEAQVLDGPCGVFLMSKSKSSKEAHIVQISSSPGDSVNKEQLNVRWSPGLGIELKKTNTGFDGDYFIKIF
jgi:hypothetical protein